MPSASHPCPSLQRLLPVYTAARFAIPQSVSLSSWRRTPEIRSDGAYRCGVRCRPDPEQEALNLREERLRPGPRGYLRIVGAFETCFPPLSAFTVAAVYFLSLRAIAPALRGPPTVL